MEADFDKVPVDASFVMDDGEMDLMEPYAYQESSPLCLLLQNHSAPDNHTARMEHRFLPAFPDFSEKGSLTEETSFCEIPDSTALMFCDTISI